MHEDVVLVHHAAVDPLENSGERQDAVGMWGTSVVLGQRTDATEWSRRIADALTRGHAVVQEYVRAQRCPATFIDPTDESRVEIEIAPVLGPFIVDGAPAGCLTKFYTHNTHPVVSVTAGGADLNTVIGLPAHEAR
ncbi:hypothetical protein [Nocardia pseudobrasiliensis]|uniref:hypothetical protein n=1 Tax=Nocardia pseudobrasiliensis TaxID=45979 RepID=UPI000833C997|nr:hypothetical protein [Nocardia pseudobrasiliensis]